VRSGIGNASFGIPNLLFGCDEKPVDAVIPEPETETIAVRPDERFDEAAVAAYLRGRLPGSEEQLTVRQFGGGAANLTYELDYGEHVYVLRRPPLGPVAPRSHDMGREHAVLSRIHEEHPPAPLSFLLCDDESLIGAPFFVMERRYGLVVRRRMPEAYQAMPDAARRLGEALVDGLSRLHAVDYSALGLNELGKPAGFIERQVLGWYGRWEKARAEDVPAMDLVHRWLTDNLPPDDAPALIHNDYKLDNTMFATDDPGRLVAVFDWDMATLGDPLSDLGTLLTYWIDDDDGEEVRAFSPMPHDAAGFPSRADLVERYERASGRDVSGIRFYHVLGLYRVAVILAQIHIRWLRGQTKDQRFAGLGDLVKLVAANAAQLAH
jgi:aminoglycoside phosphotransferase (APT) family kinase protein